MADISRINVNNTEYNIKDEVARKPILTSITTPASVQSFSDGGDNIPLKSCEVAIVAQQASGTPTPSNPLSISGFSAIDVVDCGINLWDEQWEVGSINEQGNTPSSTRIRTKGYIKVIPSNTYYVKSPNNIWFWGYDENKNYKARIPDTSAISNRTITIPSDVYYIRFVVVDAYGTTYHNDISINYPSTDTAYHHSSTHTITLPETIYGGTAELVGGNGIKTFGYVDLGALLWAYNSGSNRFYSGDLARLIKLPSADTDVVNAKCEQLNVISLNTLLNSAVDNVIACGTTGNISARCTTYGSNAGAFKTAMSGVKFVYELATPTAFTFTGTNIPTLSGVNNVYADSGDIQALEYFNDKADQIAALIKVLM